MRFASLLLLVGACRFGFAERDDSGSIGDGIVADVMLPAEFEPFWTNGSRLRARLLTPVDGGDPMFIQWQDTLLGTACQHAPATDGVERCMPIYSRADQYFSDTGCTQRLTWIPAARTCGVDAYAFAKNASDQYRAFPIGAVHAGPVYGGTPCLPVIPPAGMIHSLGVEVPPAMFVAAGYATEQIGELKRVFETYADGARVDLGAIASDNGSCYPIAKRLGTAGCRPSTIASGVAVYADVGCTQRAYLWPRQSTDPITTPQLMVFDVQACDTSFTVYDTIANITGSQYWSLTSTGCTAIATPTDAIVYTAVQSTDPYPVGTVAIGPRRGRIGTLYWVSDGQALAVRSWDHDLGVPCVAFNGTDGKLRCLPERQPVTSAYPNASCSGAPTTLTPACFGAAPIDGPYYSTCDDVSWEVRVLPNIAPGLSAYDEATCTSLDAPSGFDQTTPGAVLPPSMFAELTEVID